MGVGKKRNYTNKQKRKRNETHPTSHPQQTSLNPIFSGIDANEANKEERSTKQNKHTTI